MTVSFLTWSSAAAAGRPRCSPRWRRPVPEALADLLSGATERAGLDEAPGKSGATLERVVIDGQPYVLKHLDLARDWTMRASGCLRGAPLVLWERGILARLPGCLNQPIVAAAPERRGCALLMRDVSRWLVPATDAPIALAQHARFLRHMAALHAAFWECGDEFDVVPAMHRYLELSPWMAEAEAAAGSPHLVPKLVAQGWPRLAEIAPAAAAVVTPLARDPGPLVTPPAAAVKGGLDRGLPGSAGRQWRRHCPLVGPPAGAVPARRPGPVRLGEGARRLRRGARLVGRQSPGRRAPAGMSAG